MRDHYDVGVVGFWNGWNYGSLLNGYAEYVLLKSLNQRVLMISKMYANRDSIEDDFEKSKWHNARFIAKYYDKEDVSPVFSYEQLPELNQICDCFCAGSDQIWNYHLSFHENMYLPFVHDDKKIISFATSFGPKKHDVPGEARVRVKKYLQKYSAISLREKFGVDILKDRYGLKGELVFEPVFCIDKKYYIDLADKSDFPVEEPYMLTYILDPTPEKREAALYYAEKLGLKTINLIDGDMSRAERVSKILDLPNSYIDYDAEDFLKAFLHASYVFTDSFHGTAFSIIFNKPFIAVANPWRGAERFTDILERVGLMDRLVPNQNHIPHDEKYLRDIDYTETNRIIEREARHTADWLKWALATPKEEMPSILLSTKNIQHKLDMQMCTGCSACVNICPCSALELKPDEYGYYRSSVDYDKCTDCGLCAKVCPALKLPEKKNNPQPDCYAFIAKNEEVLESSSSGGAFPLLAREAFRRNGAVAGAAWRDDLYVEHIVIDDEKDLPKLQKSKYLQSYLGTTDREVKRRLDAGQLVLFSGCPCQVAGLKKYLGKDYENLILVDLFCGSAPSAGFFQKYLRDSFPNGVKDYQFRYKKQGWTSDCVTLTLTLTDGTKIERRGGKQDDYQKLYHPHTMCAPHCEHCPYQALPRFGDITIGDFWGYAKHDSSIDVSRGLSVVLCNNEKGRAFFESLPESEIKVKKNVPLEWIGGNGYAYTGHNYCSPYRDRFYESIKTKSFSAAMNDALSQGKTLEDYKNEARWNLNAMNFFFELCLDNMGERKFERFMQSLAGKNIAVLKVQDRAGKFFLKVCENADVNIVFTSQKHALDALTAEELAECRKADVVITCCVHGTKTHERDGVKCIDIWDILH